MPLVNLLYRCPRCGHDPMKGEKDEAFCPECGVHFARGRMGGLIRVKDPGGDVWEVPGHRLTAAMAALAEAEESRDTGSSGLPLHRARVEVRQSGAEAPVEWRGELLGFAEAMGDPSLGVLEITREALILRDSGEDPGAGEAEPRKRWALMDIRAVQTSSSALQLSPSTGGLIQFRFFNDSPFRWETLLRTALRRVYRREGLGEILEFQPRIVAE